MRLLRTLFSSGRSLASLLLLATLVTGEVADARHHLSEQGCPADRGGRDDNCICGSLHAISQAEDGPVGLAPIEYEHEVGFVAALQSPCGRAVLRANPRGPPAA